MKPKFKKGDRVRIKETADLESISMLTSRRKTVGTVTAVLDLTPRGYPGKYDEEQWYEVDLDSDSYPGMGWQLLESMLEPEK